MSKGTGCSITPPRGMSWLKTLALVVMLVLTGCGATPAAQTPAEATSAPAAATEAAPAATAAPADAQASTAGCTIADPAQPTTIEVIGWAFPATTYYAEQFKKCNNGNLSVNVKLLDGPSAQEQVRLALSGGGTSPYAVVHAANAEIIEWGTQGWLMPLNELVDQYREQYNLNDIPEKAWEGATIDGQIYGVPVIANTLLLMYRQDLFQQYNLQPPTSYDDVIAACNVLKADPNIEVPFTMNLHAGWAWEIEFLHFSRSFGTEYLNADSTPAFNTPEGVAAATKMKEVIDACMGQEGLTYSVDDTEIGLATGKVAFANLWASRAGNLQDPAKSEFANEIAFAPAAAPKTGSLLGGSAWNDFYAIPATTDVDPDLIFQLLMQVASPESQAGAAAVGMVPRVSASESGVGGREVPAAMETINEGVGIYQPNPALPLAQKALGNWLPKIGTGELSPEEALNGAAEEYTAEATQAGLIK
jgi:multiple sugar transport system substrate-binding protein